MYVLRMQRKRNRVTLRTSNYYFLGELEFCNFYFSWEFIFIYTADNFVVLSVWQLIMFL
jgi:hypothetical protein